MDECCQIACQTSLDFGSIKHRHNLEAWAEYATDEPWIVVQVGCISACAFVPSWVDCMLSCSTLQYIMATCSLQWREFQSCMPSCSLQSYTSLWRSSACLMIHISMDVRCGNSCSKVKPAVMSCESEKNSPSYSQRFRVCWGASQSTQACSKRTSLLPKWRGRPRGTCLSCAPPSSAKALKSFLSF